MGRHASSRISPDGHPCGSRARRLSIAVLAAAALLLPPFPGAGLGAAGTSRYASLGSDRINVRTGPGRRYPVEWVFVREGLPVEVVAEYELWRKIRDQDGATGWIHQSLLSSRRTAVISGGIATLLAEPFAGARAVLRAEPGVVGVLRSCRGEWCALEIAGRTGWLARSALWGVGAQEAFE